MIKTGIRFFDRNGGFLERDKILIEGPTGIGKKMLVYYMINNWIKKKKNIILINADGPDENIIKIFKRYFKTDILNYPNFIIINVYETGIDLKKLKKIVKGINLNNAVLVFDSLTGYFFNIEKTYMYKRAFKNKEMKIVKEIISFCKKCKHMTIIIANNVVISKEAVRELEKKSTVVINLNFKEERDRLKRKIKMKSKEAEDEARFFITNLGLKI